MVHTRYGTTHEQQKTPVDEQVKSRKLALRDRLAHLGHVWMEA